MSIINKTILVGRIATKPKLFNIKSKSNTAISFRLAINEGYKDENGNWVKKTSFFPIIGFNKKVNDYIFNKFEVGYLVYVEGRNYYQDNSFNIVLEKITLIAKLAKTKFNIPNSKNMDQTIDIKEQIEKMDFALDKTLNLDNDDFEGDNPWELDF